MTASSQFRWARMPSFLGRDSGGSSRSELTPVESFNDNGFVKRHSSDEKRPKTALNMGKIAQTYLQSTSIHGLQYWGDDQGRTDVTKEPTCFGNGSDWILTDKPFLTINAL